MRPSTGAERPRDQALPSPGPRAGPGGSGGEGSPAPAVRPVETAVNGRLPPRRTLNALPHPAKPAGQLARSVPAPNLLHPSRTPRLGPPEAPSSLSTSAPSRAARPGPARRRYPSCPASAQARPPGRSGRGKWHKQPRAPGPLRRRRRPRRGPRGPFKRRRVAPSSPFR